MKSTKKYSEQELIRLRCISDTMFHVRYMFKKSFKKKFVVNWHHKVITDKLDEVYSGKCKRLLIRMPPRYGKTEIAVKQMIAKGLGINPASKFIHLSYSSGLALDNSEEVRDLINEDFYKEIYPYVKLSKSSKAKNKWYTTEGGGVYATATGGQITGFGAGEMDEEVDDDELMSEIDQMECSTKFSGAIIIDDPLKPDDADSDIKRERVNNRFETTIRSRTNSRNTPIIVIGQAVHENDLIGYLLENEPDEWELLNIPAIIEDEEGNETALWEFKHTLEELHKLKEIDPRTFNTQMMQDPNDAEGKLLPANSLMYETLNDLESVESLAFFDPADTGGDMLCGIFIDVISFEDSVKFYVKDVIHTGDGIDAVAERLPLFIEDNSTSKLFIESNGIGLAFIKQVRDKINTENTSIRGIHQKLPKDARISGNYEKVQRRFIFKKEEDQSKEYKLFMKHLTGYAKEASNTNKKDAIDNASFASSILDVLYKKSLYNQNKR